MKAVLSLFAPLFLLCISHPRVARILSSALIFFGRLIRAYLYKAECRGREREAIMKKNLGKIRQAVWKVIEFYTSKSVRTLYFVREKAISKKICLQLEYSGHCFSRPYLSMATLISLNSFHSC